MFGHLKPIYVTTLLKFAILVFGNYEKGFYGFGPSTMYLDTQAVAFPVEPSPKIMDVRYKYGDVLIAFLLAPLFLLF